jgi:hypothetical protein
MLIFQRPSALWKLLIIIGFYIGVKKKLRPKSAILIIPFVRRHLGVSAFYSVSFQLPELLKPMQSPPITSQAIGSVRRA